MTNAKRARGNSVRGPGPRPQRISEVLLHACKAGGPQSTVQSRVAVHRDRTIMVGKDPLGP